MEWRKKNRCFLSIHKAFNFSMYSDLSLSISLSLSPFSLYISKFPFYIQRHYRKAFNSSHNVLCIWILKEEMETFFAAPFTLTRLLQKKNFFFLLPKIWKWKIELTNYNTNLSLILRICNCLEVFCTSVFKVPSKRSICFYFLSFGRDLLRSTEVCRAVIKLPTKGIPSLPSFQNDW